jgi:hypothetical protein
MGAREGYHWAPRTWAPSQIQARILDGVARGLTNAEIAAETGISPDGVKWHVSRALAETGLEGRRALAVWWQSPRPDIRMSLRAAAGPVTLEYRRPRVAVLQEIGRPHPLTETSRQPAAPVLWTAGRSADWATSS